MDRLDRRQRPLLGHHLRPSASARSTSSRRSRRIPLIPYSRDNRFRILGLVNEPCFRKPPVPIRTATASGSTCAIRACPPDPFANAEKYPGVAIGARGKTDAGRLVLRRADRHRRPAPVSEPRVRRDGAQASGTRSATTAIPTITSRADLVKPYRVGMSCGFCHVGPNPTSPPADPENPRWENLSSNVGAQYFWVDRIFNWQSDDEPAQLLLPAVPHVAARHARYLARLDGQHQQPADDERGVPARPAHGARQEDGARRRSAGGGLNNKQFNDFVPASDPLAQFFSPPPTTWTPRVLKDGSDSVGALGALNRVYINIGLFSEEWLLHFRPIIGGQEDHADRDRRGAQKNSAYWGATEMQTPYMARFFLRAREPHYLKDAPGSAKYLTEDAATVRRGKEVFADTCARCHSSKLPDLPAGPRPRERQRQELPDGAGTDTGRGRRPIEFKSQMRQIALRGRLPDGQLSVDRAARPVDAAPDQRVQPARHQRHRRRHLGQLLVAVLQGAAVGRVGDRCGIR